MNAKTMEVFEPYDCFYQIQMTDETSHSSSRLVGQQSDAMKKQEEDNSSSLVVDPPYFHQRKTNKYDNDQYHLRALQEDNDDIFLLDHLLQSPQRSPPPRNDEKQEETAMRMQDLSCCFGQSVPHKTDYQQEDTHSIKAISRNVTPTFKLQQQEERKKRKNHFLNPGTHLARTLNFPYKSDASNNEDRGDYKKRLKIWNDETDQGRILEKHFNPEWQFQFMNEFYGRSDAPSLSSRNKMKSRAIKHNYDPSEEDRHYIERLEKIDECIKKRLKNENEEGYYVTKPKSSLDTRNILKEASLKLLAAMDLSDISRNNVYRVEEEINFDRKKYIL